MEHPRDRKPLDDVAVAELRALAEEYRKMAATIDALPSRALRERAERYARMVEGKKVRE